MKWTIVLFLLNQTDCLFMCKPCVNEIFDCNNRCEWPLLQSISRHLVTIATILFNISLRISTFQIEYGRQRKLCLVFLGEIIHKFHYFNERESLIVSFLPETPIHKIRFYSRTCEPPTPRLPPSNSDKMNLWTHFPHCNRIL